MIDGATMRGGVRTTQSTRLETVMTTPDTFEKVVEFYEKKYGVTDDDAQRVDAPEGGQSVFSQDDSKYRPALAASDLGQSRRHSHDDHHQPLPE